MRDGIPEREKERDNMFTCDEPEMLRIAEVLLLSSRVELDVKKRERKRE